MPCLRLGVGLGAAKAADEELLRRGIRGGAATAQHPADLIRRRAVELADQGAAEAANGLVRRGVVVGVVAYPMGGKFSITNRRTGYVDHVAVRQRIVGIRTRGLRAKRVDSPQ